MTKRLLIPIILLCFSMPLLAQGFRGIPWGASVRDVRKKEGREIEKLGEKYLEVLTYKRKLESFRATVKYIFYSGKFSSGDYEIDNPSAFEILYGLLQEKYGKRPISQCKGPAPQEDLHPSVTWKLEELNTWIWLRISYREGRPKELLVFLTYSVLRDLGRKTDSDI